MAFAYSCCVDHGENKRVCRQTEWVGERVRITREKNAWHSVVERKRTQEDVRGQRWKSVRVFIECGNVEIEEGEQVKDVERWRRGLDSWGDEGGTSGYVITVDYRDSVRKGGTWPGGRATLQGNLPRGARGKQKPDDARYIYISYMLLAELHLFEQVNAYV